MLTLVNPTEGLRLHVECRIRDGVVEECAVKGFDPRV
jgi:hypothetical protein